MSSVPSKLSQKPSHTTLNGIFAPPKMNHRRDFLRENKLNVKGTQPNPVPGGSKRTNAQKPQPPQAPQKRGDPQQRGIKDSVCSLPRNGNNKSHLPPKSVKSFCNKQMQTDDIHDREFLYEALQRCTAGDGVSQKDYTEQYDQYRYGEPVEQLDMGDGDGAHAVGRYNYNDEPEQEQLSARSYRSHHSNQPAKSTSRSQMTLTNGQTVKNMLPIQEDALSDHFDNFSLNQPEEETYQPRQSGRSRVASNRSSGSVNQKITPSVHKAGNLPRYLEREKREKEEELLRKQQKDPDCPFGYHLLTEQERLAALATADKQFKSLITELNHMPMTTKTLRIEARKNEIERELCNLENDIRLFSKPKVYVKQE